MHIGETQLEDEARVVHGFFLELRHLSDITRNDHLEFLKKKEKRWAKHGLITTCSVNRLGMQSSAHVAVCIMMHLSNILIHRPEDTLAPECKYIHLHKVKYKEVCVQQHFL